MGRGWRGTGSPAGGALASSLVWGSGTKSPKALTSRVIPTQTRASEHRPSTQRRPSRMTFKTLIDVRTFDETLYPKSLRRVAAVTPGRPASVSWFPGMMLPQMPG